MSDYTAAHIYDGSEEGLSRARRALASGARGWHFAGRDPRAYTRTRLALGAAGDELAVRPLGELVDELRDEYLERLGAIPVDATDVTWFESTAAEKQFGESRVMREAAFAVRAQRLLAEKPDAVIVCENPRLAAIVAGDPVPRLAAARPALRSVASFAAAHTLRAARTRTALRDAADAASATGPLTLVVAWFDARSIGPDGSYADPYFGDLVERAISNGRRVAVMPVLVPGSDLTAALEFMRAHPATFLPPHLFVSAGDIRAASTPAPARDFAGAGSLGGVALEPLLLADAAHDVAARSVWFNRLVAAVPERMRAAGIEIDRVVLPFENLNWEKRFVLAVRQAYPSATVAGYQHSTLTSRKLRYFESAREASISPLPDTIVTNSEAAHDLLSPVYGARVVRGGALRYSHSIEASAYPAPEKPCVVAALSLELSEAAETMSALVTALGESDTEVLVKPHPVADVAAILEAAAIERLPRNFTLLGAREPAPLDRASVLVATSSTVVLEAMAHHVPVVSLELARGVNESPLLQAPEATTWAYDAPELGVAVDEVLAQGQALRDRMAPVWDATVAAQLTPAGPETYAALLG